MVKDSISLPHWDVQGLYRALPLAQQIFSATTQDSPVCNLSVDVGTVFHDGFIIRDRVWYGSIRDSKIGSTGRLLGNDPEDLVDGALFSGKRKAGPR